MKKLVLVLCLLLIGLVSAQPDDLVLSLDKTAFAQNSVFEGDLNLEGTEDLEMDILVSYHIGQVSGDEMSLSDFLDLYSGDYVRIDKSFSAIGSGLTSLVLFSDEEGEKFIGKKLRDSYKNLKSSTLSITGSVTGLQIDVGDDGVLEWTAQGTRTGWGENLDVEDAPEYGDFEWDKTDPGVGPKCENIELVFDGVYDEIDVQINAKAEKVLGQTGNLLGKVGSSLDCTFLGVGSEMGDVSCSVKLMNPVSGKKYSVCISSDKMGAYKIPSLDRYYFFNIQAGEYDGAFSGTLDLESDNIKDAIEDYIKGCVFDDDLCVVPLGINISSGSLNINSFVVENSRGDINDRFWELEVEGEKLKAGSIFDLSKIGFVKTPSALGDYSLSFEVDGVDSNEVDFEVTETPKAVIDVDSVYGVVGRTIVFDGSGSSAPGNRSIVSYLWNFGDNSSLTSSVASHSYYLEGNYTVKLTVTDSLGVTDVTEVVIFIGELGDYLGGWIDDAIVDVNESLGEYSNASSEEGGMYSLLGFDVEGELVKSNLTGLKNEFLNVKANILLSNESKELEYTRIASSLDLLKVRVPRSLAVADPSTKFGDVVRFISDVPSSSLSSKYSDVGAYHSAIYEFNVKNVNVDSTVTEVYLVMLDGSLQDKRVVEKAVTAPGASLVVENLKGFTDFSVVSPLASFVGVNSVEWDMGSGAIVYTLSSGVGSGITVAFTTNVNVDSSSVDVGSCGDGMCTLDYENETSCPEDCAKKVPWVLFIVLFVVLLFGAFYFNFYKGPGNFRDLSNAISINLFHRRLFTNEQDLENLKRYVDGVLAGGHSVEEVRKVLLNRGWSNKQIDFVMKRRFK